MQAEFDLKSVIASLLGKSEDSYYELSLTVVDALPTPNRTSKSVRITVPAAAKPKVSWGMFPNNKTFEQGTLEIKLITPLSDVPVDIEALAGIKDVAISIVGIGVEEQDVFTLDIPGIAIAESSASRVKMKYSVDDRFNKLSCGDNGTAKTYMVKYKITDKLDRVVEDSRSFTVTPPVFEWAMAENAGDIFAKYAYLRVKAKDADKVTFYHNGSQLTDLIPLGQEENGVVSFVWNNLTAGQSYSNITAKYDGGRELSGISFTTENDAQLPDNIGQLEEWNAKGVKYEGIGIDVSATAGVGKYASSPYRSWERWEIKGWGTLNSKTTQYGAERTSRFTAFSTPYTWTRYVANSGTIKTEGINGGNAAQIRTVGWGEGNKAPAISSGFGDCENSDAGELFLGDNFEKGILFTSRPRKITFYYRYIPKNIQDYGEAVFVVKDSQQNIIATKSFKFESQSSWTQESILLEYGVTKASSLCIIFKSTVNESCLERNSENFSHPDSQDMGKGEFVGSQLYIDDVELIYDYQE